MKIQVKKVFFCLLACAAFTAMADSWELVAKSVDGGVREYVDRSRVQKVGNSVIFWSKKYGIGKMLEQHWRKGGYPDIANQYKKFSYSLTKWEVDCQRMRFRILGSTDYSKDGTPLESNSTSSAWNEMLPDSLIEVTAEKVCAF